MLSLLKDKRGPKPELTSVICSLCLRRCFLWTLSASETSPTKTPSTVYGLLFDFHVMQQEVHLEAKETRQKCPKIINKDENMCLGILKKILDDMRSKRLIPALISHAGFDVEGSMQGGECVSVQGQLCGMKVYLIPERRAVWINGELKTRAPVIISYSDDFQLGSEERGCLVCGLRLCNSKNEVHDSLQWNLHDKNGLLLYMELPESWKN